MILHEKLKSYNLILASRSPRRQTLLKEALIAYTLAPEYEVEELYPDTLPAEEVPLFLSELKSAAYPYTLNANDILITADTVVILDGEVIGKPTDSKDAVRLLTKLSGKCHKVISGVTLRSGTKSTTFSAETEVSFKRLTEAEIAFYVDNFRPLDKAGAYGIQEWIGYIAAEKINGSFYNVMGLPICKLGIELNRFTEEAL